MHMCTGRIALGVRVAWVLLTTVAHATLTPTAQPTSSPTPAPSVVPAAPCAVPSKWGIGTLLSTSTCNSAGTVCTTPTKLGCVAGTSDTALQTCAVYYRRCTASEWRALCPGLGILLTNNNECVKRCDLETVGGVSACVTHTFSCPAAYNTSRACLHNMATCDSNEVAPPQACTDLCGEGVRSCNWWNTSMTRAEACDCGPTTAAVGNSSRSATDLYCRVQGSEMEACSADEGHVYCGIDGALGCTKRWLYMSPAQYSLYMAYVNMTAYSGTPFSMLECFVEVGAGVGVWGAALDHQLRVSIPGRACSGTLRAPLFECKCLTGEPDGSSYRQTALPRTALMQGWPASRFATYTRFRYGTCAFSYVFQSNMAFHTRDVCPTTRAGACHGRGYCGRWTGSTCNVTHRRKLVDKLGEFQNNSNTPLTTFESTWIGISHMAIDLRNFWPAQVLNEDGTDFTYTQLQPGEMELGNASHAQGLLESRAYLALWRTWRDGFYLGITNASLEYHLRQLVPASLYECAYTLNNSPLCTFLLDANATAGPFPCDMERDRARFYPTLPVYDVGYSLDFIGNPVEVCMRIFGGGRVQVGTSRVSPDPTPFGYPFPVTRADFQVEYDTAAIRYTDLPTSYIRAGFADRCSQTRGQLTDAPSLPYNWTTACVCDAGFQGAACEYLGTTNQIALVDGLRFTPPCGSGTHNASTGRCTCPANYTYAGFDPCALPGCPDGRWGYDCTRRLHTTNAYFEGYYGNASVVLVPCIHGTLVITGLDFLCSCDEGWVGEGCDIPACPVDPVSGLVCWGRASCRRRADQNNRHACTSTVPGNHPVFGQGSCSGIEACAFANGTVTLAGGCACQLASRYALCEDLQGICSSVHGRDIYAPGQKCDVCRWAIEGARQVEQAACRCPVGYRGPLCELWPCMAEVDGSLCNGAAADCIDGQCVCPGSRRTSGWDDTNAIPYPAYTGTFCEYDITTECGVCVTGVGCTICNLRGNCTRNPTNDTFECVCDPPWSAATKCALASTAAPTSAPTQTPFPTTVPTAGPSAAPTPSPTYANFTILPNTACNVSCYRGECRHVPDATPRCFCTEPNVWAYDNTTGNCEVNMCRNGSLPHTNGTVCVCVDPTQVLESPPNGPCRPALNCTYVDGHLCGQRSRLEGTGLPPAMATAYKNCIDGTCACSGMYRRNDSSGLCEERCDPDHARAFSGAACVCGTGWDPAFDCAYALCPARWRVDPNDRSTCICQPTLSGANCSTVLCQNGTLTANYTCACHSDLFAGTLCERRLCNGTLAMLNATTFTCTCSIGGGWSGPTCSTNRCLNGGVPDPNGWCACPNATTQNRPFCNASASCVSRATEAVNGTCLCNKPWADAQCQTRYCLNNGIWRSDTNACVCGAFTGPRCETPYAAPPVTTGAPVVAPTAAPTPPTVLPTASPSAIPTARPTTAPTPGPTPAPPPAAASQFSPVFVAGVFAGAGVAAVGLATGLYYGVIRKHLQLRWANT